MRLTRLSLVTVPLMTPITIIVAVAVSSNTDALVRLPCIKPGQLCFADYSQLCCSRECVRTSVTIPGFPQGSLGHHRIGPGLPLTVMSLLVILPLGYDVSKQQLEGDRAVEMATDGQ
ncbi:hypothetical protein V8B97DRAFT_1917952 [Scleroderma yunnanense]